MLALPQPVRLDSFRRWLHQRPGWSIVEGNVVNDVHGPETAIYCTDGPVGTRVQMRIPLTDCLSQNVSPELWVQYIETIATQEKQRLLQEAMDRIMPQSESPRISEAMRRELFALFNHLWMRNHWWYFSPRWEALRKIGEDHSVIGQVLLIIGGLLILLVVTLDSYAEPGFADRYQRPYNLVAPTTQVEPDNPCNPVDAVGLDNPFNPINAIDPDNPVNPINQYHPNNPFNPLNAYRSENPLNPLNAFNPTVPFAPIPEGPE